jgi:hypothetical protein
MLNPAGHVLANGMRSIAYIRKKDEEKVAAMRARILPHFLEEVNDGPLREWNEFAELLHRVRDGQPGDWHSVRMGTYANEISDFTRKSRAMHWLETKHPGAISFAQGDAMQRLLNPFTRAA